MIETLFDLRSLTVLIHIAAGAVVLALFWAQVFSRKGSPMHVTAGKIYYWAGMVVLLFAAYGVIVVITRAMLAAGPEVISDPYFSAVVFLGYLTVVTFAVLEKGRSAIRFRGPSPGARAVFAWLRALFSAAASLALIAYALIYQPPNAILLFALSPIGLMVAHETLSFQRNGNSYPQRWVAEHMDGMFGSGIAFHTAFFVFGANRVFEPLLADTPLQLLPWVLPTLIGVPATEIWKRRMRREAAAA